MQGQKNTYKIKIFRIHIQRIVTGEQKQKRQKIQKTDTDNTYRKEDRNNKNRRKKITETENIDRRTETKKIEDT